MMKNKDIIITGLQSWDIPIGSNALDIATEMAKNNRVLYVNSPMDYMTRFKNKPTPENIHRLKVIRGQISPIRHVAPQLWVLDLPFLVWSVNGLPDGWMFDWANRINNRKIFRYVRMAASELGFKDVIHYIDNDIYRSYYSKEFLSPVLSVYYRRDNLQPFPYWKKHVARLEPKLIEKSDLVLCNSPQIAAFAQPYNTHTEIVGSGVDISAYDPERDFTVPESMAHIPTPRIGYIGDITSLRLDPELIYHAASKSPGYSFVMIGGEDDVFKAHRLHELKNVYFLGSVPKIEVARYMAAMQVCTNPQLVNEITIGNYPRKADEYLAMGKPVVATYTKAMELFWDHVYLSKSPEEFKQSIERALMEDCPEKRAARIRFARSHSWEANVSGIYRHIEAHLN
ncbi:MAG: glycosyltransferase [Bacteroidota bacterium]|nr:glycosyltransferase [Bacteroidota bacterium]